MVIISCYFGARGTSFKSKLHHALVNDLGASKTMWTCLGNVGESPTWCASFQRFCQNRSQNGSGRILGESRGGVSEPSWFRVPSCSLHRAPLTALQGLSWPSIVFFSIPDALYVCMYACVYVCMCICMYVCV